MTPAERLEQRQKALKSANRTRLGRAQIKRGLAARKISFREALDHESAQDMKLHVLLRCQYRWGNKRTNTALRASLLSPLHRVGDLTGSQRSLVLKYLREPDGGQSDV